MSTNIILFILTLILLLILILVVMIKDLINKLVDNNKRSLIITLSLSAGLVFLLFSFFAPYFFTSTKIGKSIIASKDVGLVGDTMGGIMNPFIAISGVLLTFLAFYLQYQANRQVQEQFEEQLKKENLDYIYNKFNSQIQLILYEINKFQFSHYYPFYSKDMPVRPEIPERRFMGPKHESLLLEYEEKVKEYQNSKKYEKRSFEGVLAINELFLLLIKRNTFTLSEDYFDKSFNNPKINEVYYILNYFNLTINEIENNLIDKINLKEDLINRLIFLYNTKLSAIVNNNIENLDDENLLKIEMKKLNLYFNSKSIQN